LPFVTVLLKGLAIIGRLAASLVFLALAGGAAALERTADAHARFQILTGPAFEQFAGTTEKLCPRARFRFVTPGDLSWEGEGFDAALTRSERRRDARAIPRLADGTPARCAGSPGGLSCPTEATLDAIRAAGLMDKFARFACTHTPPQPRSQRK
jgi:hypothetical protein